ncbi:MAG TPA: alpha/beta hydrolase [Candidatus Angelobacter sp.]|nr:alpha/beta hydrolase [Candidatus Angelobacter sp.]
MEASKPETADRGLHSARLPEKYADIPDFSPPSRRSLRGRLVTHLVRWGVRLWPKEDPAKLARRARSFFDLPNVMGFISSRGIKFDRVEQSVCGEWVSCGEHSPNEGVVLYLHGGGYVSCSARSHRTITAGLARRLPGRVFALDYRLAPEHPFPAAVDDAAAAYQWLLEKGIPPERMALAGDSAGGGLAIAALVRLRRSGHPMPACVVCLSPWVDLTGRSQYSNQGSATFFQPDDITALAKLYLHGEPPENPEASPVFAELTGLPPLLVFATRTELLANDAARLHARAQSCGVGSVLVLYPGLPHVWQIYGDWLPEARLALEQAAGFIAAQFKTTVVLTSR